MEVKIVLAVILLLATVAASFAQLSTMGIGPAGDPAAGGGTTGKILLVDAASFLLQTDSVSKVCIAGGC